MDVHCIEFTQEEMDMIAFCCRAVYRVEFDIAFEGFKKTGKYTKERIAEAEARLAILEDVCDMFEKVLG